MREDEERDAFERHERLVDPELDAGDRHLVGHLVDLDAVDAGGFHRQRDDGRQGQQGHERKSKSHLKPQFVPSSLPQPSRGP